MSAPRLHASTGGHSHHGGPTVVLIHGAGGNRTQWSTQARHLAARGSDVLAIDLPGHGNSADPACQSVPDYAAAVLADVHARGIESFALAGHSMGALISLHIAAAEPERIPALALIGAGLGLAVSPHLLEATSADPHTAAAAIVDWGHSPNSHMGAGQSPGLWMDGVDLAVIEAEIQAHPGALYDDFRATAAYDGTDYAAAITARTIVISGQRDLMTPPKLGRALADAIDGAQYVELSGAGHMLMTERPTEVSLELGRWASLPGSGTST